jgi:hypothetical protein
MLMKVKEYFDNKDKEAGVISMTTTEAVIAVDSADGVPPKRFAWLEFLLGQDKRVKVLGRVEDVKPADTGMIVRFVFKHVFPDDRRVLMSYLSASS